MGDERMIGDTECTSFVVLISTGSDTWRSTFCTVCGDGTTLLVVVVACGRLDMDLLLSSRRSGLGDPEHDHIHKETQPLHYCSCPDANTQRGLQAKRSNNEHLANADITIKIDEPGAIETQCIWKELAPFIYILKKTLD